MLTLSERWTIEELSGVMHVPPGLLRRRLGFWVSQGVLKEESTDTFIVVEKQKGQQRTTGTYICTLAARCKSIGKSFAYIIQTQ